MEALLNSSFDGIKFYMWFILVSIFLLGLVVIYASVRINQIQKKEDDYEKHMDTDNEP